MKSVQDHNFSTVPMEMATDFSRSSLVNKKMKIDVSKSISGFKRSSMGSSAKGLKVKSKD